MKTLSYNPNTWYTPAASVDTIILDAAQVCGTTARARSTPTPCNALTRHWWQLDPTHHADGRCCDGTVAIFCHLTLCGSLWRCEGCTVVTEACCI